MTQKYPTATLKNLPLWEAFTTSGNDGASFLFVDSSITYQQLNLIDEIEEPLLEEDSTNFIY